MHTRQQLERSAVQRRLRWRLCRLLSQLAILSLSLTFSKAAAAQMQYGAPRSPTAYEPQGSGTLHQGFQTPSQQPPWNAPPFGEPPPALFPPPAGFSLAFVDDMPRSLDGRPLMPPQFTPAAYEQYGTPGAEPIVPEFARPEYAESPYVAAPGRRKLIPHKDGFFQKLTVNSTFIGRDGDADMGLVESQVYTTCAVPLFSRETPLLITPGFQLTNVDGPNMPDLPAELYDAYLHFMWIPQISERWSAILAISPGVYSDFEDVDDGAMRITGRGIARWDISPGVLQAMLGIEYLDRDDISLLPVAGLIWTPSDAYRFDLVFPKPKLAMLLSYCDTSEDWAYLAAEFGGGSWAIQRTSGAEDQVAIRDYRLMVGWERKFDRGAGLRFEIGYVFGREVEYGSGLGDFSPSDSWLARGGFSY